MRKKLLFLNAVLFFVFTSVSVSTAQTTFNCKVDGDEFTGKLNDAVVVKIGEENYIQIRVEDEESVIYLYLKAAKVNSEMPSKLEYMEHDHEKGQSPDAEIIWAPDGGDGPQWNTVKGNAVVTSVDETNKSISGTFEFTVEKFSYSSKADQERPSLAVTDGMFANVQYRTEEIKN